MKTYQKVPDEEIKLHIADTAFALLKEKNIDELKVEDIRTEANVGRTTYYRYYGSRRGIRDALLFSLEAHFKKKEREEPSRKKDDLFFDYLFDNREKLLLLKRNNLMDILDDLVLFVYVPKEEGQEVTLVKYIASGLWMGLIRAILEEGFTKDRKETSMEIQEGLRILFLQTAKEQAKT